MEDFYQSLQEIRGLRNNASVEKIPSPPNITWQHTWSLEEIQDALLESVFAQIPNEIMLRIFKLLCVGDLCNVSLVCRRFKMLADQDEIWERKYSTPTKLYSKSCKQVFMDWMYMKCLRNIRLRNMSDAYSSFGCDMCLPPLYPVRPPRKHQFQAIGGFHQHPNSSSSMTIKLSVDVEKTAHQLIQLLEKASAFQDIWRQSSVLKQMITRYYRFLYLKASYPSDMFLVPTLDIEIVWQTHLLRPAMYEVDCIRLFRRVIDHSLLMSDIQAFLKDQAFQDTCQLYEQKYGEQYCALPSTNKNEEDASNLIYSRFDSYGNTEHSCTYWDKTQFHFSTEPPQDYENPFSFTESDLVMDGEWLGLCQQFMSDAMRKARIHSFYYTESNAIDLDEDAINRLKKSYERFLYMAAKYPVSEGHDFVSPPYSIDIIWHSHMQEPLNYLADCARFVGYALYHSPWPVVEDENISKARDQRNISWKNEFEADLTADHLFNTNNNHENWSDEDIA